MKPWILALIGGLLMAVSIYSPFLFPLTIIGGVMFGWNIYNLGKGD